jgi:hypothetical protein
MFARLIQLCSAVLFAYVLTASSPVAALAGNDGIVRVKSAYPIGDTIERLKKDIADKGIKFFNEIDQSKLAADAGIKLQPSVLLNRQSAARHAIHHGKRQCRARLAGAVACLRKREGRGLDRLYRFRLDRTATRNQEPQGPVQDGVERDRVHHVERESKVAIGSAASSGRIAGTAGDVGLEVCAAGGATIVQDT